MWILRTRLFRRVLYSKSRGSTPSRYRLVREELGGVRLPLISSRQQKEIANEVARRRENVRRLREEATLLWEDAKRCFEQDMLGSTSANENGGAKV